MLKPVRWVGTLVVLVCLAGSLLLTALHVLTPPAHWAVLLTSFVPWAVLGYAVALVLLLLLLRGARGRRAVLAGLVVAAVGLALHVAWLAPLFVADPVPTGGERLRVMSLNLQLGGGDAVATARLAHSEHPDVVVLEEVTPAELDRVEAQGLGGEGSPWPYVAGEPAPQAAGTVVLSRYPLTDPQPVPVGNGGTKVRVGSPRPVELIALHTTYPLQYVSGWSTDLDTLRDYAVTTHGPHLLVGDFNATLDHRPMRRLLATGLTDAVDAAGSGWQPTWPRPGSRSVAGLWEPFRLMAIDHVLVSRGLGVTATRTHVVPDTDHLALVADVVLPRATG